MSEDKPTYNKVQLTAIVNGDNWTFRTDSGEDLAEVLEGVAEHSDRAIDALGKVKQVAVAKGVFTGDASKGAGGEPKKRTKDTPPPSTGGGDVPTCEHGEMKDLRANNYKYDFYCPSDEKDWKKRCRPVKL